MQVVQLISPTPAPGAVPSTRQIIGRPSKALGRPKKCALADRTRPTSRQIPQEGQNGHCAQPLSPSLEADLVSAIPSLRAFAISLARKPDCADDLVQETLARACQNIRQFTKGTNIVAWLVTILRNEFYSEHRRRCRELENADSIYARTLVVPAQQLSHLECRALYNAVAKLPNEMSEPLLLVTVGGLSYAEAAQACSCKLGTVKSRVNRARARLAAMLDVDAFSDFGADPLSRCVATRAEECRQHVR